MTPKHAVFLASAAALIAGCAYNPRVVVTEQAVRPTLQQPPTYALVVQDDRLPADSGGPAILREALAAHGWTEARGAAAWTLRATYAIRPEHVGARGADPETWLVEPRRTPWWRRTRAVHTLTLGMVEPGGQRESHRVSASISGPVKPPRETLQALAEAAAARLDPQWVPPSAP